MAYNINTDYAALIKQELAKPNPNTNQISTWQKARDEKIASNPDKYQGVIPTSELLNSFNSPAVRQRTAPSTIDNSGLIKQQYGNLLSSLKAQIQQSINNKQQQINQLPQQYQPLKDQSEVRKYNELRTALEQAANMGDRGGIGRQNALNTQIAGENRLKDILLQQENTKNSLLNDISNLNLEQAVQEGQLSAQQIKDLIANNQYVDTTNYSRSQDAIRNALSEASLTGKLYGQPTLAAQQFEEDVRRFNIGQNNWQQQFTYQQMQDKINNMLKQGQLSLDQANMALQQAKFAADQDPNSLDNQYKQAQIDALRKGSTTKTEQTNNDFASDYATLKAMSVKDAIDAMNSEWANMIARYGIDGAKKLWNTVLYDAIQMGQASAR